MSRMSETPWRNIRVRSMPMPNAKPVKRSLSTPQAVSTRGFTTPQPPHSIQPSPLQVRQLSTAGDRPRQTKQRRSTSALGSVNGKYDGRKRVVTPSPKIAPAKWSSDPLRWAMLMPRSMTSPSTWWNIGLCVASYSSVRNTRPGQTT